MAPWREINFRFSMTSRDALETTIKTFDSLSRPVMIILNKFGNQDFIKSVKITGMRLRHLITAFPSKEMALNTLEYFIIQAKNPLKAAKRGPVYVDIT